MRGLDPRIHDLNIGVGGKVVDGRVEPGHDALPFGHPFRSPDRLLQPAPSFPRKRNTLDRNGLRVMRGPDPRIHDLIFGVQDTVVDGRGEPGHGGHFPAQGLSSIGPNNPSAPIRFLFTMSNSALSPGESRCGGDDNGFS